MSGLPEDVAAFLDRSGLAPVGPAEALTGGVSSDIWRVPVADGQSICVKRALSRLRVAADWQVPTDRNRYEAQWYGAVAEIVPGLAPQVIADDPKAGLFAMEYLPPERFALWKAELLAGRIAPAPFETTAHGIGRIHAATAGRADLRAAFASDRNFEALRLAPYLRATAERHPDLSSQLGAIADRTAATKLALVHGDLSPKNILIGPDGAPVLLDAECAWFGDPAFDPAFCLNHILLKALHMPANAPVLLDGFRRFWSTYEAHVDWEPRAAIRMRTATLLPGLLLARIDGKSPVEYITEARERDKVRDLARAALAEPSAHPVDIARRLEAQLRQEA